jgi:hypothetical protein
VSCCMRDAVTFETLGIPTIIIVNDVFEPIAHATATLLRLPEDYVENNVVWLPHPTSNLTAAAAAALIDERIDAIRDALLGRGRPLSAARVASATNGSNSADDAKLASEALETAREAVRGLTQSLRADGADLVFSAFDDGVLHADLHVGDVTCDDGSCIMPADVLERMLEAMLRGKIAALRGVKLREIEPRDSTLRN